MVETIGLVYMLGYKQPSRIGYRVFTICCYYNRPISACQVNFNLLIYKA